MKSYEEWVSQLTGDELCQVCSYSAEGCKGGVRGGPNGPIYPPCADGSPEDIIDEDAAWKAYEDYLTDEMGVHEE